MKVLKASAMSWRRCSFLAVAVPVLIVSCSRVPLTGRKQMRLLPEEVVVALSYDAYLQVKRDFTVEQNTPRAQMVERTGMRLARAAEQLLTQEGLWEKYQGSLQWEYTLLRADSIVNAFCMPGGKIAVFTGILPITQNEAGLAVVLGHEIGHALARHGNERLSHLLSLHGAMALLDLYMQTREISDTLRMLVLAATGAGAQVGLLLPYSRKQELEADYIGLILMAMAGYDPREAVRFWERMLQTSPKQPPEFLSTHPSHQRRIEEIKKALPEALKYYKP